MANRRNINRAMDALVSRRNSFPVISFTGSAAHKTLRGQLLDSSGRVLADYADNDALREAVLANPLIRTHAMDHDLPLVFPDANT